MKKTLIFLLVAVLTLVGCSSEKQNEGDKGKTTKGGKITMVWLPNESAQDSKESRDAIGKHIKDITGLEVEHKLTTDYNIAIEAISNGEADIGYLGGESYIKAHSINEKVVPLVVGSGPSGTIKDAMYYSWFVVKDSNSDQYKDGEKYSIKNIKDKKMSFVSQSSTSGFAVPSKKIMEIFPEVKKEELLKKGAFFSEVLFGQSHQGSLVNLLSGKSDVSAICDTCVISYIEQVSGEHNVPGAVYEVKKGAKAPFDKLAGEKFTVIEANAVLNEPIAVNKDKVNDETIKALIKAFTSEQMNNDEKIWAPEGVKSNAILEKEGDSKFVTTDDAWYDLMRK